MSLTKSRSRAAIINKDKGRPETLAKKDDYSVAPGQYDDGKRFNSDVKAFKIGEKRLEKPKESMGPGAYEPDKADKVTKPRMANIDLGKSPARPASTAKGGGDVNVAPGQYDDGKRFNSDVKSFKIGEKRPEKP